MLGLAAAPAGAHDTTGHSTLEQTIVPVGDAADFQFLKLGPGEPYLVRTDLAQAGQKRLQLRRSLVYVGQITDWQLPDEESPAREERFDAEPFWRAASSGYRPQEPLAIQTVEASIRQMNQFLTSPVPQGDGSRARMLNAVMTGDLADSMQLPTRRAGSGTCSRAARSIRAAGRPTSRAPIARGCRRARSPTGPIRASTRRSLTTATMGRQPDVLDPRQPAGNYDDWPSYTNLFDQAQQPFIAQGLGVPTYVAFGNHDALYQGTVSAGPGLVAPGLTFEDVAVNCPKLVGRPRSCS